MTDAAPNDVLVLPPEIQALIELANQRYQTFLTEASHVEVLKLAAETAIAGVSAAYAPQAQWLIENGYLTGAEINLNADDEASRFANILIIQQKMAKAEQRIKDSILNSLLQYGMVGFPLFEATVNDLIAMGMSENLAHYLHNQLSSMGTFQSPEDSVRFQEISLEELSGAAQYLNTQLTPENLEFIQNPDLYLPDLTDITAETDNFLFFQGSPVAVAEALDFVSRLDSYDPAETLILRGKLSQLKNLIDGIPDEVVGQTLITAKERFLRFHDDAQARLQVIDDLQGYQSDVERYSSPAQQQLYQETYGKLYDILQRELAAYPSDIPQFMESVNIENLDIGTLDSLYQTIIQVINHNPNYREKGSNLYAMPFDGLLPGAFILNSEGYTRYEEAQTLLFSTKSEGINPIVLLGGAILGILAALHPAGDFLDIVISLSQGDLGGVIFNATIGMIPGLGDGLKSMHRFAYTAEEVIALRRAAGVADAGDEAIIADLVFFRSQMSLIEITKRNIIINVPTIPEYIQRGLEIRQQFNIKPKPDGTLSGNYARADFVIAGQRGYIETFSGKTDLDPNFATAVSVHDMRKFFPNVRPINGGAGRVDSEAKIMYQIAYRFRDTPNVSGDILIYTDKPACLSCYEIILSDMHKLYPNIKIYILTGYPYR